MTKQTASIFKACDVRGVAGEDWDALDARQIGHSVGHMVRDRGDAAICVGGDFRRSTPSLKQALIQGLLAAGMHVHDVGLAPTPLVHFAAAHLNIRNVAMVTASHNPGQYNGVKLQIDGQPASPVLMRELQERFHTDWAERPGGQLQTETLEPAYVKWVVEHATQLVPAQPPADETRGEVGSSSSAPSTAHPRHSVRLPRPLHIVLDSMEGAATHLAPRVLREAGLDVTCLYSEPDPDFASRAPNPAEDANLAGLVDAVRQEKADAGVALDGDGDRVILVDHTGRIARPEQIAAVLLQSCFQHPTVVYDLKCASVLPRAVTAAGGRPIMRPSGYGFIKETMIRSRAEMGVEASGHHFFGLLGGGDDGMFTAVTVLRVLQTTGRTLAELTDAIGWPAITPDLRVPCAGDRQVAVDQIAGSCGGKVVRLDGVRADYETGWALARVSITEPVITLRFEGREQADLKRIAVRFLAGVPDLRESVMEMIDDEDT